MSKNGRAKPVIVPADDEQWSVPADDLPTVQDVIESAGLTYLGSVDAPDVGPPQLLVPVPIFKRIQQYDREAGAALARRQEFMDTAVEMLGIDTVTYYPVINFDTGVITLTPRMESPV